MKWSLSGVPVFLSLVRVSAKHRRLNITLKQSAKTYSIHQPGTMGLCELVQSTRLISSLGWLVHKSRLISCYASVLLHEYTTPHRLPVPTGSHPAPRPMPMAT